MSETPPWLNGSGLPENERDFAFKLSDAFMRISFFVEEFNSALSLYDFCDVEREMVDNNWKMVAGRDGAMTIWHFYNAMEGIRHSLDRRKYPVLVSLIDFDALRGATKRLRDAFPQFQDLRTSVAHSGEFAIDFDAEHATKSSTSVGSFQVGAGSTISNSFFGRRFTNSFGGATQSYEMSGSSLAVLDGVRKDFFGAFADAARALTKLAVPSG